MKSIIEEPPGDQQLVVSPMVEARRGITVEDLMPVLDLAAAVRRHNFMTEVARTLMVSGVDYGVIPGTTKPTLLKPGAERLCTLFGLSPELHEVASIEDWDGTGDGHGEALFYYHYRIRLVKNGILLGEGDGSCSSRETKFRYRAAERKCPRCGKPAIIKGREEYGGGWLCFARKGGCGAKFRDGDAAIEGQPSERVANPDIADAINTIQKMAHKRALVAAVLIATNASEFYTQDVEDLEVIDIPSGPANARPLQQAKPSNVSPITGRLIPEPLTGAVEAIQKDGRATQSFDAMKKAMEHRGGAIGLAEYERIINQFSVRVEKKNRTRGDYVEVLLDMWEAYEALQQPEPEPVAMEAVEASDDSVSF